MKGAEWKVSTGEEILKYPSEDETSMVHNCLLPITEDASLEEPAYPCWQVGKCGSLTSS